MVDCVLICHQMRKVEKRCCNFCIEVFINKWSVEEQLLYMSLFNILDFCHGKHTVFLQGPGRGRKKTNYDALTDAEKPFSCERKFSLYYI